MNEANIGRAAASNWLSGGRPRISSIVRIMLTVLYCVLSRCLPLGVGADHQADGAVGVDVVGAVLGVVLDDEDRRLGPDLLC